MATAVVDISKHINDKITYHEKLRQQLEAVEDYERCAYHRDEIVRLKNML
jgi:protein-arginine kinase activator protein McsA